MKVSDEILENWLGLIDPQWFFSWKQESRSIKLGTLHLSLVFRDLR